MKWYKQKKYAIAIMLAVMVVATLFSAHMKLDSKIDDIEYYFYNGTYDKGMGIQYDLSKINDALSNTISLANKYNVDCSSISSLPSEYDNCSSVADYASWYKKVTANYTAVISDLENANITRAKDLSYIEEFKYDYKSAVKTISNSEYNGKVTSYKQETNSLFSKLILKLSFTREVATFA